LVVRRGSAYENGVGRKFLDLIQCYLEAVGERDAKATSAQRRREVAYGIDIGVDEQNIQGH
jgi:hypothetical protein